MSSTSPRVLDEEEPELAHGSQMARGQYPVLPRKMVARMPSNASNNNIRITNTTRSRPEFGDGLSRPTPHGRR